MKNSVHDFGLGINGLSIALGGKPTYKNLTIPYIVSEGLSIASGGESFLNKESLFKSINIKDLENNSINNKNVQFNNNNIDQKEDTNLNNTNQERINDENFFDFSGIFKEFEKCNN